MTSSALQSRKWQLIGMSQWCRSALCGHPLPALTDNWTHDGARRHTIAPISHTRPSPHSRRYYSFSVPLRIGGWVGRAHLLKVACSGPGVSRTHNLSVRSPPLHHCTASTIENQVRGRSRSLKMAPFDRPYATFYWSAIINITLSCTIIFELFDVE